MRITCGWCQRPLGEKEPLEDKQETHGICDDCLRNYFPHHYDKIKGILEVEKIEDIFDTPQP